ncbi:MAG: hypothetical protein COW73_01205 [Nitrospirae bacterium CG18_big_fil_WC_8_21_14_2_50_70_55]|nr:hypothetical protein [Deltaproteobacteria bacterium]OIP64962.1 MAG: hypothetical protein AUK30_05660 [Nitrospirae bacterium CG2_30_70_394]PIQ07028.1 MAG: hypothetical protein COW73_01205 [Nitrospirae bacterium CG18_big_fil_WC_8_21_14_2_50_70_55]PIU79889.1 MAG: hypothetical protein COS73_02095 [Nitrospirae bacterium CG06_land_8_20_14_3_00_70_43]PIW82812.1 MAG: hypothetical protein COZ96_06800 [Nitrospirae bacterium CG_4_8_14_3_um_filter_70_85]PIX84223.1 MAG: hypothetical protein COZ33_01410 
MVQERVKPFLIHLAASALVAAGLTALLAAYWYPLPYFYADGGWQGLRLVLAVDCVLGPLITLVIYNSKKSSRQLFADYAVVITLQVVAFSLGTWTVFHHHTAMVIFADSAFYTVDMETARHLPPPAAELIAHAERFPIYAVVEMPEEVEAVQALRREALSRQRPLYVVAADRLRPLDFTTVHQLARGALTPAEVAHRLPADSVHHFLADHDGLPSNYWFIPLRSRYENLLLAFHRGQPHLTGWLPDLPAQPATEVAQAQ